MYDVIAGLLTALFLFQTAAPPSFEVASVKPSKAEPGSSKVNTDKGRMSMRNVTLKRCIRSAYGVPEVQIFGGPKWLDENRFDINAKAAGPAEDPELMIMLQPLLAERFNLLVRRETRTFSGYALVLAKGGLKAKASTPGTRSQTDSGRGRIKADVCTMEKLALRLSSELGVPVTDLTGTAGPFDFNLEWTPDDMKAKPTADLPSGPSIFSALQEQLGLKLEARKVPTEVIVVDRAELPSEN
jgi:uncharacterized protein (TIGR03435 family)